MPSGQILYLMMFVGKYSCTSHVLQYSSSRSYEHSRSLQSSLCPGVVTVLICSFFVAALLFIYINLKNGGKIIHIFTNHQTFSYLFAFSAKKSHSSSNLSGLLPSSRQSYLNRSSIRTSFCTMPECIPLSTPYVVTIVVTKLFRVLVSSLNIAILLRSFSS